MTEDTNVTFASRLLGRHQAGFTLLELLVVIVIMITAGWLNA